MPTPILTVARSTTRASRLLAVLVAVAIAATATTAAAQPAAPGAPHAITLDDMIGWKTIGPAVLSADGRWVAYRFSPAGEVIRVTVTREGTHVRTSVCDQGPGVPPAHAERVFERFFTHRPAHADARDLHAGLGLPIARAIVESYGGSIRLIPAERGARFDLVLPLSA